MRGLFLDLLFPFLVVIILQNKHILFNLVVLENANLHCYQSNGIAWKEL